MMGAGSCRVEVRVTCCRTGEGARSVEADGGRSGWRFVALLAPSMRIEAAGKTVGCGVSSQVCQGESRVVVGV